MTKQSIGIKTFSLMLTLGLVMSISTMVRAGLKRNLSEQDNRRLAESLVAGHKNLEFKRWRSREIRQRPKGQMRCGDKIRLTPLLPQLRTSEVIPVELTVEANPTLLIHMGETSYPVVEALFKLYDEENRRVIYEKNISLKDKIQGIISISLPETALIDADAEQDLLEVDKTYKWYLIIYPDPQDPSARASTAGVVKRIAKEESLVQELAKTPELDHPKVYADYGIWIETVSSLAKLRERYPNNPQLEDDWRYLLESVGLDKLISEHPVNRRRLG
ncbi:MAG: DUF928 domain-containing protein [Symploca sp. SIO2C1]|nr:DUF928 domain-containing protein [Symploca sp. SIO2C1]